jgi:hypothetical protein
MSKINSGQIKIYYNDMRDLCQYNNAINDSINTKNSKGDILTAVKILNVNPDVATPSNSKIPILNNVAIVVHGTYDNDFFNKNNVDINKLKVIILAPQTQCTITYDIYAFSNITGKMEKYFYDTTNLKPFTKTFSNNDKKFSIVNCSDIMNLSLTPQLNRTNIIKNGIVHISSLHIIQLIGKIENFGNTDTEIVSSKMTTRQKIILIILFIITLLFVIWGIKYRYKRIKYYLS